MKPTLMIVEDCEITRERLEDAIHQGGCFRLISSVGTYESAVTILQSSPPDILLTDIDLPDGNGIDLIKLLKNPKMKKVLAIVITVFGDETHVINALKAGASGYLLKDDEFIEINNAITQMTQGGSPISPAIARYLLSELYFKSDQTPTDSKLSERESETLLFVSKGYTSKEIGKMLEVSFHTINAHIKNIYRKLAVNNRAEAIYEATRKGII